MSAHNKHTSLKNNKGYMMVATGYDSGVDSAVPEPWLKQVRDLGLDTGLWLAWSERRHDNGPKHILQEFWKRYGNVMVDAMNFVLYIADTIEDGEMAAQCRDLRKKWEDAWDEPRYVVLHTVDFEDGMGRSGVYASGIGYHSGIRELETAIEYGMQKNGEPKVYPYHSYSLWFIDNKGTMMPRDVYEKNHKQQ